MKIQHKEKEKLKPTAICLIAVGFVFIFSACGMVKNIEEEDETFLQAYNLANSATSTVSNCAQNAFRVAVHPSLVQNCNGCHGSAQGSSTVSIAYIAVKARVNFSNISNSTLVRKVADATHCTNCGATFSAQTAARMEIWKKAESGDAATCAEYANAPDGGGATVKPFDLGGYNPPNPNDTIIINQGLTEYQAANGVHSLLVTHCQSCHIPGGLSYFAPFAVANSSTSYREAKPRVNFSNIDASILLQKASVVNHGGGCASCGGGAFIADLRAKLISWATQENNGTALSQMTLSPLAITTTSTTVPQTLSWDLGVAPNPVSANLAGGQFRIDVTISSSSNTTYRFSNPRIIAPGGRAVRVKKITFILDGVTQTTASSYFTVDTQVNAGQTKQLASFPALIVNPNGTGTGTQLRMEFDILQGL